MTESTSCFVAATGVVCGGGLGGPCVIRCCLLGGRGLSRELVC